MAIRLVWFLPEWAEETGLENIELNGVLGILIWV